MKASAALVACLVASVAASGIGHRAIVAGRDEAAAAAVNPKLKFDAATIANSYEYRDRIHGTVDELNEFVDDLTLSQLKRILGDNYGKPFHITFLDIDDGSYLGYIAGYFTTDGRVVFDEDSKVPGGGSPPHLQKQPSLAPQVTTVTLSGSQSSKIIADGKVTTSELKDILGADYGKPFRLTLTDGSGGRIGTVSGSFTFSGGSSGSSGGLKIDSDSHIPKAQPTVQPPTVSEPPKVTVAPVSTLATTVTVAPPKPTDAPSGSNTGSVTISGQSSDEIKSTLNSLSYDYILKAVSNQYGPFYITFASPDGSLQGYIKGTISKDSYNYQWSYTTRS